MPQYALICCTKLQYAVILSERKLKERSLGIKGTLTRSRFPLCAERQDLFKVHTLLIALCQVAEGT